MSGKRADAGRDREIAAAYASGLSLRAVAVKFGIGKETVKGAVVRTGTPLRPAGRPARLSAADPAVGERYRAGYGTNAVARDLGVSPGTVGRALRRAGAQVRTRSEAAKARRLREAGERGEHGTPEDGVL